MIIRYAAMAVTAGLLLGTPANAQDARFGMWGAEAQTRTYKAPSASSQNQQRRAKKQQESLFGSYEEDYEPDEQEVKRAVAVASGGPRPSIAAQSPKTVSFSGGYAAGSVVIDTAARKLYYVKGGGSAYVYPITVGKQGFAWSGTQKVSRIANWPDWTPPAEMRLRKPHLPLKMTGGINNPLGAKAIYLGSTLYRIHGTNDAGSIGTAASSGCIRMHNGHVVHLSRLVGTGTTVHVLRSLKRNVAGVKQKKSATQG